MLYIFLAALQVVSIWMMKWWYICYLVQSHSPLALLDTGPSSPFSLRNDVPLLNLFKCFSFPFTVLKLLKRNFTFLLASLLSARNETFLPSLIGQPVTGMQSERQAFLIRPNIESNPFHLHNARRLAYPSQLDALFLTSTIRHLLHLRPLFQWVQCNFDSPRVHLWRHLIYRQPPVPIRLGNTRDTPVIFPGIPQSSLQLQLLLIFFSTLLCLFSYL